MKEHPNGNVVIVPPAKTETPEQAIKRIFGMTAREYAEKLMREQAQVSIASRTDAESEEAA